MKKSISTIFSAILPPALWAVLIFILSSQEVLPSLETSLLDFLSKKLAHIFVYAVLYFLLIRSVNVLGNHHQKSKAWLIAAFFCLIYAASDEFHQSTVPGRQATFRDIGYDMLGVFIAFLKKSKYV